MRLLTFVIVIVCGIAQSKKNKTSLTKGKRKQLVV